MHNQNVYDKAKKWIENNTLNGNGITVTHKERVIYPEVTGYYIPTLLNIGDKDRAIAFAKYLMSIQKEDGSWYDMHDEAPYIFDSAQILKGLVAIRDILPEADEHIIKGVDWILSQMTEEGRLVTPNKDAWGSDDTFCSELIHTYCLTPIRDAGILLGRNDYVEKANKIKDYYISNYKDKILNFSLLSHFYAYVMEGLHDMGETELIREAMNNIDKTFKKKDGAIPGLNNVEWVCSTGMFQLAIVWYKLGEVTKGNEYFEYTCTLQNESGGWFGGYKRTALGSFPKIKVIHRLMNLKKHKPYYFPDQEISWAVKYYFDAVLLKDELEK